MYYLALFAITIITLSLEIHHMNNLMSDDKIDIGQLKNTSTNIDKKIKRIEEIILQNPELLEGKQINYLLLEVLEHNLPFYNNFF